MAHLPNVVVDFRIGTAGADLVLIKLGVIVFLIGGDDWGLMFNCAARATPGSLHVRKSGSSVGLIFTRLDNGAELEIISTLDLGWTVGFLDSLLSECEDLEPCSHRARRHSCAVSWFGAGGYRLIAAPVLEGFGSASLSFRSLGSRGSIVARFEGDAGERLGSGRFDGLCRCGLLGLVGEAVGLMLGEAEPDVVRGFLSECGASRLLALV